MTLDLTADYPFVTPKREGAVEVERHRALIRPEHTVKGMFVQSVIDALPAAARPTQRYTAFRSYPMEEYFELLVQAATVDPSHSPRAALIELGNDAYPTFANSLVGRVLLGVLGDDIDSIMSRAPRAYGVSVEGQEVTSRQLGRAHWRVGFEAVPNFLDCVHLGVLEGAIIFHGQTPNIRLHLTAPDCGIFDVRWSD